MSDFLISPAAARGEPWPFESAVTGLVEITDGPIDFTPVPRLRKRRDGWTPEAQRAFIDALEQCGCVARAARAAGMTARSAYRLLVADGAESFAQAWDQAIARGTERLRMEALDRVLNGVWVPVMRRGRIVRFEHRVNDRLAIALLSGRESSVADRREQATSRRKYRLKLLAHDREQAEQQAQGNRSGPSIRPCSTGSLRKRPTRRGGSPRPASAGFEGKPRNGASSRDFRDFKRRSPLRALRSGARFGGGIGKFDPAGATNNRNSGPAGQAARLLPVPTSPASAAGRRPG